MKRVKFIRHIHTHGCGFVKHGARHDKYKNHVNGKSTFIPRHTDIDTDLCVLICKMFNAVNMRYGYPMIDIHSPPEFLKT